MFMVLRSESAAHLFYCDLFHARCHECGLETRPVTAASQVSTNSSRRKLLPGPYYLSCGAAIVTYPNRLGVSGGKSQPAL